MKTLTIVFFLCFLAVTAYPGSNLINPYMFKSATPTPTPADVTAPTLISATVDKTGQVLTLEFSEAVMITVGSWETDWTISGTTNFTGLVYITGDGTSTINYNVSGHGGVLGGDDPILNYSGASTVIEDAAGNALAPIVDYGATNNAK